MSEQSTVDHPVIIFGLLLHALRDAVHCYLAYLVVQIAVQAFQRPVVHARV